MPKVNSEQLTRQLKQGVPPVIFIYGDETLLVEEACDTVRERVKQAGFNERELHHTDGTFNWQNLIQNANSLSLFSEKKLIEIRLHNGKPGDSGSKALVEYCTYPSEDTLLLIISPKLERSALNSKWFKQLDQSGFTVPIWPISSEQLPQWLDRRLQKQGLQADSEALDVLAEKVEGNLLAGAQEVDKLLLNCEQTLITGAMMRELVADSARYNVFGLIDKALTGDAIGAGQALNGLRSEGSEPLKLLWALTNEVRTLVTLKEAIDHGMSFNQAAKSHRIWKSRERITQHALNRLALRRLHLLLRQCIAVDKAVKGMGGDPWALMQDITLGLSGINILNNATHKLLLR